MLNLKQKRINKRAEKMLEIFFESLEQYDKSSNYSEDDFLDEILCEYKLKKRNYDKKEILNYIGKIDEKAIDTRRRDLIDRYFQLEREPYIRKKSANILRKVRNASNNGLKTLTRKEQYNMLLKWELETGEILGNEDLYLSRRVDKLGNIIPLRKDVTKYIFSRLLDIFKENSSNRAD